jgi:hypothetical protein
VLDGGVPCSWACARSSARAHVGQLAQAPDATVAELRAVIERPRPRGRLLVDPAFFAESAGSGRRRPSSYS